MLQLGQPAQQCALGARQSQCYRGRRSQAARSTRGRAHTRQAVAANAALAVGRLSQVCPAEAAA